MPTQHPTETLSELLHRVFGHPAFRAHQQQVCEAASNGRDVLLVMPTGAGKSLCYQLPALYRRASGFSGAALVISPLIALMDDQAAKLSALNLRVARIHSGLSRDEARDACRDYLSGALDFLFIAPERLRVPGFPEMLAKRRPSLIAIDEAHCISAWGHDFRPDYRTLGQYLPALRPAPIIALTATATPTVQRDIALQLNLQQPAIFITGFRRHNLAIQAIELSKPQRPDFALKLLQPKEARPAILYAASRKDAEEYASRFHKHFPTAAYHAGLDPATRDRVQRAFLSGKLDVVVATVAFGMGVDKADVRSVIHWSIPKSVEAYYQEVGRAGRDGLPARAILLSSRADLGRLINFIRGDAIETGDVLAYVRRLRSGGAGERVVIEAPRLDRDRVCLGIAERAGLCTLAPAGGGQLQVTLTGSPLEGRVASICRDARDRAWDAYHAVEAFTSASGTCRRRTLLDHFADGSATAPEGRCCDVCDPDTIGLPDPASLTPRRKAKRGSSGDPPPLDPASLPLLNELRAWRARASNGKPAYTVAHNSTLEAIATLRPTSTEQLARIRGVGPTFVERHGADVLALVAGDER